LRVGRGERPTLSRRIPMGGGSKAETLRPVLDQPACYGWVLVFVQLEPTCFSLWPVVARTGSPSGGHVVQCTTRFPSLGLGCLGVEQRRRNTDGTLSEPKPGCALEAGLTSHQRIALNTDHGGGGKRRLHPSLPLQNTLGVSGSRGCFLGCDHIQGRRRQVSAGSWRRGWYARRAAPSVRRKGRLGTRHRPGRTEASLTAPTQP
jgi:hypothetical protein